ncbi:MAG TPA: FAD-dependent monooxygenase [Mucilaginibacter sp.]|jgi:2-polyprenyl-6-methoxyphenol hydroxylase-like FAD-dependent oxidoreductase|nr:FAD-dependent monooxygenase [Mucilaginibacter sp.]
MQITENQAKVLIVGAGPSGLMMAAQLLRYGIQPLIIDNKQGPTNHSNALAVQARSLEIYRQMGIVDKAVKDGKPTEGLTFYQGGKPKASFELMNIGKGQTPYPYVLLYQQYKNERLLLDYLTQHTCPVYWGTTLVKLRQQPGYAEAVLQNAEGEYTLKCDWVAGADGAHSTVRKQLNIPFSGDTYPSFFYLADIEVNANILSGTHIQLFMDDRNLAGFFPMPEKDCYRVIGIVPKEFGAREDLVLEDILPYMTSLMHSDIKIVKDNWFTTYKLHHRMAESFRKQNCFLIGDAAHIHSPVGGQGMNTGLQDAYNLAWKLAGVINGQINPDILNSYAIERMPVARRLLDTTDRIFKVVASGNWLIRIIKRWIWFNMISLVWKSQRSKAFFFKVISQTGISYRESKINLHLSNGDKIKAGDRIPYLEIYDERKKEETDLHAWCGKPGFTLIIMGRFDEMFLFNIAKWITNRFQGMLNFYYLPPSGKNLTVFEAFETDSHREKAIIVRPDMHIGYMNDMVSIAMLDNYLVNVVGIL